MKKHIWKGKIDLLKIFNLIINYNSLYSLPYIDNIIYAIQLQLKYISNIIINNKIIANNIIHTKNYFAMIIKIYLNLLQHYINHINDQDQLDMKLILLNIINKQRELYLNKTDENINLLLLEQAYHCLVYLANKSNYLWLYQILIQALQSGYKFNVKCAILDTLTITINQYNLPLDQENLMLQIGSLLIHHLNEKKYVLVRLSAIKVLHAIIYHQNINEQELITYLSTTKLDEQIDTLAKEEIDNRIIIILSQCKRKLHKKTKK